jgi:hypothetical protein
VHVSGQGYRRLESFDPPIQFGVWFLLGKVPTRQRTTSQKTSLGAGDAECVGLIENSCRSAVWDSRCWILIRTRLDLERLQYSNQSSDEDHVPLSSSNQTGPTDLRSTHVIRALTGCSVDVPIDLQDRGCCMLQRPCPCLLQPPQQLSVSSRDVMQSLTTNLYSSGLERPLVVHSIRATLLVQRKALCPRLQGVIYHIQLLPLILPWYRE